MKKILPLIVMVLIILACGFPGLATQPAPLTPPQSESAQQAPTKIGSAAQNTPASTFPPPSVPATEPPIITLTPSKIPPTSTPASTLAPADLPFIIDCSALPASRKSDCDAFIIATRDQVYPLLRDVTGISLSQCYQNVQYKILPTDPSPGAGGLSGGNKITYNQAYSIDLPHRYDVHELLHSVLTCGKSLDHHVFHEMILNYVYDKLGVHDAGYFVDKSSGELTINLDFLLNKAKTDSGADLQDDCIGIFQRKLALVYFDRGDKATMQSLVRSTINPLKFANPPSEKLVSIWGTEANQIEALLETLKQKYQYTLNVPVCGY